jgi:hypothetical protein
MKIHLFLFAALVSLLSSPVFAQNNRINTYENVGWYNTFITAKLPKNFGIHGEYQWRRTDFGDKWQQSLLRTGINYNVNSRVQFRLGYGWIETFAYGDIPLNAFGKNFTEHRIFQMMQLSNKEGRVEFSHRFMLEQRFVGKYALATDVKEREFVYMNRMRYMFRAQIPFRGKDIGVKTAYAAVYDEVFLGFGTHVNANVFDQNRFGALIGYRFNSTVKLEAGYFNQILQLGRQVDGKNVFQHNTGFIINAYLGLDFSEKK